MPLIRALLIVANLTLAVLFPLSWFQPLLRAGLLPIFGLSEVTVVSGLQSLWRTDVFLALVVTCFAIFAPVLKVLGVALVQFGLASHRLAPALNVLGKLAMADVFLIALYVVIAKQIGVGRVEVASGLYLFTGCVLGAFAVSLATAAVWRR